MAYEPKPGSFSLFKNDRKEKANHPDYTGTGQDLNGKAIRISAWIKEGTRGKFMSCNIQPYTTQESKPQEQQAPQQDTDFDDVPF